MSGRTHSSMRGSSSRRPSDIWVRLALKTVRRRAWQIGAVAATMALPGAALSQNRCDHYVGETVSPVSFSTAVSPLARLTPRSEFESSADYAARVAAVVGTEGSSPLIIAKAPQRPYIEYNADTQRLRISEWAFGHHLDAAMTLIGTSYWNTLHPSAGHNIDVVVSDPDTLVGAYEAVNSFGVRARIRRFRRITSAIFDRAGQPGEDELFPSATEETSFFAGEIPMTPSRARVLEPNISLAIVAVPKAPFLITGSRIAETPTLDRPRRVDENFTVLVADIQCGLVLDESHKVLAAYPTR